METKISYSAPPLPNVTSTTVKAELLQGGSYRFLTRQDLPNLETELSSSDLSSSDLPSTPARSLPQRQNTLSNPNRRVVNLKKLQTSNDPSSSDLPSTPARSLPQRRNTFSNPSREFYRVSVKFPSNYPSSSASLWDYMVESELPYSGLNSADFVHGSKIESDIRSSHLPFSASLNMPTIAASLPANILSYIATHLNKTDQRACVLVSKRWSEPFLDAYWGKLTIDGKGLDTMFNEHNLREAYQKRAHRTWALHIDNVDIDLEKYIPELQKNYPEIKYLSCNSTFLLSGNIPKISGLSCWSSLSHLEMTLTRKYSKLKEILPKLSVLSCLVCLTIKECCPSREHSFSYNDFESIHDHLPRLDYIDITCTLKRIPENDAILSLLRLIEPAITVTKIKYNSSDVDTLWMFYFALKYPNLHRLDIGESASNKGIKVNQNLYENNKYENQLKILSTLDRFFPCLKRAETPITSLAGWPFIIFYETLHKFGVKLEHGSFFLDHLNSNKNNIDDNILKYIKPVAESLKVLKIHTFAPIRLHFDKYMLDLDFRALVELNISFVKCVEIECLFDCFPVLETLRVDISFVTLTSNTYDTQIPHPLKKLEITNSVASINIFSYISSRCRQLRFMSLEDIKFKESHLDTNGIILISMPLSRLDTLIAFNLGNEPDYVKHYSITQTKSTNVDPINQGDQEKTLERRWYHTCFDKTNRKPRVLAWELGKRDIEFAERYYKDFQRRRSSEGGRVDMEQYDGFVLRRFWKRDFQHGAVSFRFDSVKNYFLVRATKIESKGKPTKHSNSTIKTNIVLPDIQLSREASKTTLRNTSWSNNSDIMSLLVRETNCLAGTLRKISQTSINNIRSSIYSISLTNVYSCKKRVYRSLDGQFKQIK
ncbi:hypothetical protein F4703DRAFT_1797285 [Phycomyces blakesleeanus]